MHAAALHAARRQGGPDAALIPGGSSESVIRWGGRHPSMRGMHKHTSPCLVLSVSTARAFCRARHAGEAGQCVPEDTPSRPLGHARRRRWQCDPEGHCQHATWQASGEEPCPSHACALRVFVRCAARVRGTGGPSAPCGGVGHPGAKVLLIEGTWVALLVRQGRLECQRRHSKDRGQASRGPARYINTGDARAGTTSATMSLDMQAELWSGWKPRSLLVTFRVTGGRACAHNGSLREVRRAKTPRAVRS